MFNLYKIFKGLLVIVWLIDILNINFIVNDISVANFLDQTLPLNTLFWFLLWLFLPTSEGNIKININRKEDKHENSNENNSI